MKFCFSLEKVLSPGQATYDPKRERNLSLVLYGESRLVTPVDLFDPELYLNRELTWLNFNRRVLAEAEDHRNPLLERVKFLAITGSNIDEFFMKRIGGLKLQT